MIPAPPKDRRIRAGLRAEQFWLEPLFKGLFERLTRNYNLRNVYLTARITLEDSIKTSNRLTTKETLRFDDTRPHQVCKNIPKEVYGA